MEFSNRKDFDKFRDPNLFYDNYKEEKENFGFSNLDFNTYDESNFHHERVTYNSYLITCFFFI